MYNKHTETTLITLMFFSFCGFGYSFVKTEEALSLLLAILSAVDPAEERNVLPSVAITLEECMESGQTSSFHRPSGGERQNRAEQRRLFSERQLRKWRESAEESKTEGAQWQVGRERGS